MNSRAVVFLDKYRQLEAYVRSQFRLNSDQSPIAYLMRLPQFRLYYQELDYCRQVRNVLSHNDKIEDSFLVEPSTEMLDLLDGVLKKIQNPVRAKQIAIPKDKVLCKTLNDFVLPTMREMNEKVYTHIPIMNKGAVCGVFSENTLLSYLVDEELVCIDQNTVFHDLRPYLPLELHKSESFRFVASNTPLNEIQALFENALEDVDRIGMVFVTANGKPHEKMLGIITAWDIAGHR